jgi:hypothetical protein
MKEKLKNDIQQLQYNHKADIREREQIEQLLNRDLTAAKDEISNRKNIFFVFEKLNFFFYLKLFYKVCKLNMNEL